MPGKERRIDQQFNSGNDDRHVFRFCAGHSSVDRNLFNRHNAVARLHYTVQDLVAVTSGTSKQFLDCFWCWRKRRDTVGHSILLKICFKLFKGILIVFTFKSQIAKIKIAFRNMWILFFLCQRFR